MRPAPTSPPSEFAGWLAAEVARALEPRLVELVAEAIAGAPAHPDLLTSAGACQALSVSKSTLSRLVADGMPHVLLGSERRFRLPEINAWLDSRRTRPEPTEQRSDPYAEDEDE